MRTLLAAFLCMISPSLICAAGPATRPSADAASPLEKKGWTLTFHDEFDGAALDEKKWSDHYYHGRTHGNDELEYYAPDAYSIKDGKLHLIAREVPAAERGKTQGKPYASGMVEGSGKFAQKYGWFEIRAKMPSGKGYWPAFWLLPEKHAWPPEIDILEILCHDPATVYFTTHWRDSAGKHKSDGHRWKGPDFSAGFHTFAVDWEPGSIVWYVDGIERARTSKGVPDEPMYIIANLAVGGDWPGAPDTHTQFPGEMVIDYVRVYARLNTDANPAGGRSNNPVPAAATWVNHFKGMAAGRVEHELGAPQKTEKWTARGISGTKLIYQLDPESKLQLFCHDGEVIEALLLVESE